MLEVKNVVSPDLPVPIPDWLLPVRERLACFAGLEAEALIQALLIRYDRGAVAVMGA